MPLDPTHVAHLLRAEIGDVADLVLGRRCLGCTALGPGLCPNCLAGLRHRGQRLGSLAGLPTVAALPYSGLARDLILAYKEEGFRSLAPPLGALLADAIALAASGERSAIVIPIPAHRRSRRGFDSLGGIVAHARRHLIARGFEVRVSPMLRPRARYPAMKGLGRDERAAGVAGAFAVPDRRCRAPVSRGSGARRRPAVVVVDDVITTGATVTEAVRTLQTAHFSVDAVAAVAAVARR